MISTQQNQQETFVHVISILNVTRYATAINWKHINVLMDTTERTQPGYNNLIQYHAFSIQQHQLSANCTTHQIHLGQSPGFSTLHVRNCLIQFLLLINVPVQDCAQQTEIYKIFKLRYTSGKLFSML